MRLRIGHTWGTAFDEHQEYWHYLFLRVEGAEAERMQVRVSAAAVQVIEPTSKDLHELTEAVLMLLLDRFSHLDAYGLAPLLKEVNGKPTYIVDVVEEDATQAKHLSARKSCKYQKPVKGDLSCTVATTMQSLEAVEMATTRHLCRVCPAPDDRLACSNFSHARVFQQPGGRSIELRHALCERGQGEIDRDRTACRPGGHECWEREVEFEQPEDEPQHILALHDLFEFVDARWKSAFREHLLSSRRAVAFGKLSTPCQTRTDLEAKLSALAHVMKGFAVPDELLKDEHRGKEDYQAGRTLARVESALERALAEDAATIAAVKSAVAVLRGANGLRNAAQHGGADVAAAFARFGLPYPPPAASDTWARIQSRVAKALHQLADAIPDM